MITHGNKQISEIVYARKASEGGGAVRLKNIIRGAQVVFVGQIGIWLKFETRAAILAAFGQTDCWQVIKATNAYLNALAATDPTKAAALAGLINEDPMMVCSLGLQPQGVEMPIRWANNGGSAYVVTTVRPSDYPDVYGEITWIRHAAYGWDTLFGVQENNSSAKNAMFWLNGNTFHIRWGNTEGVNVATGVAVGTGIHRAQASVATGVILDGKKVSSPSSAPWATKYMCIFKGSLTSSEHINASFKDAKIGGSINIIDHWYVPFIKGGVMEILDVFSGDIQERHGTFTESYTLPDGTPWTPLNKTP